MIPNVKAHPLYGCWLKINRAREQFDALRSSIREIGKHPADLRTAGEFNPTDKTWTERVEHVPELPHAWGPLIGDIANNYRSALELIAFELVFIDQKGREKKSAFPLVEPTAWNDPGVQAGIKYLTPAHQALIKACQPNPKPGEDFNALLTLAALANDNKHRVVQPAYHLPVSSDLVFSLTDCGVTRLELLEGFAGALDVDAKIFRATLSIAGPNPKVEMKGVGTVDVALRNGVSVQGLFAEVEREVVQIVERFAPEFETPDAIKYRGVERRGRFDSDPLPFKAGAAATLYGIK